MSDEEKIEIVRKIEAYIKSGMSVCESCREVGVSEKSYYRWRKLD